MYALHAMSPPGPRVQPSGRAPLPGQFQVTTQPDVIGSTHNTPLAADVSVSRYIDQNTGGATGVSSPLGFTIGMQPWRSPRMSGITLIPPKTNIALNTGPVGESNWQGRLKSGVEELFSQGPTLEQIYTSLTGG